MSEQMSVTRALAELKTLDARITKAINAPFVEMTIGGKVLGSNRSVDEARGDIKSSFQSYEDLVKRRNAIKCAIVKSNAETKVVIGKTEMYVSEAIERKNSIAFDEQLIDNMRAQLRIAIGKVEKTNVDANTRLNQMLEVNLGKDRKTTEEDYAAIAKPFMAKNEAALVDPLNIEKLINELQEKVDEFKLNVDFALSEINAVTKITV